MNKAFKITYIYNHNDFDLLNNNITNLFGEPSIKDGKLSIWKSDIAELKIISIKNKVAAELNSLEYKRQLERLWNED